MSYELIFTPGCNLAAPVPCALSREGAFAGLRRLRRRKSAGIQGQQRQQGHQGRAKETKGLKGQRD